MDWTGIVVGALVAFALSLALWWFQYRKLVPRLEFARDLSKLTDSMGSVYRFKVRNTSRYRGAIDLTFDGALHLGPDVQKYSEARLTTTHTLVEIYTAIDGVLRLGPGDSRVVRFDLRMSRWKDLNPRLLTLLSIDPDRDDEVRLEDLLTVVDGADVQVRALAYDEISGSRKYFASKRYGISDVKAGPFDDMVVVESKQHAAPSATPSSKQTEPK
jgi:hypothetical protein